MSQFAEAMVAFPRRFAKSAPECLAWHSHR